MSYTNRVFAWDFDALKRFYEEYVTKIRDTYTNSDFVSGYYSFSEKAVGDVAPSGITASANYYATKLAVKSGQSVVVRTKGGDNSASRAWALVDNDNVILELCTVNGADYIDNPIVLQVVQDGYLYVNCVTDQLDNAKVVITEDIKEVLHKHATELEKIKTNDDVFSTSEDNTFYICDSERYIIAKIDENGLSTTKVSANIFASDSSSYVICDSEGYIIAKIDKNGLSVNTITTNLIKDEEGNVYEKKWSNYELFTIGDSLCVSGKWQTEVAKNTGLMFDNNKNVKSGQQISTGGTTTGGDGFDNAVWRTKNLIDGNYIEDEGENTVIIIENINDYSPVGVSGVFDESAKAIIPTTPIEGYLYENWGTELLQSIPNNDRKMNAVLALEQTTSGKNLAITNLPVRDGQVILRIYASGPGTLDYFINVLHTDTIQDILDKILEINYTLVTDVLAQDEQSVDFVGTNITITYIDKDNTGMLVSVTDTANAKRKRAYYFVGNSVANDWEDTTKWLSGSSLTFSMGYKSVIELLQRTYPKIRIILSMFPLHSTDPSDYLLPNGTYDTKAYSETSRMLISDNLRNQLQHIANYYCIPLIDVFGSCGIGISNHSAYYNINNVHPKDVGYKRFGQVIASKIINYL